MSIICPNFKNKDVAREFEELKNATSEAAAYHIWSQNNGNGIDKAPNGEPSKLFSDLLSHYNGDRTLAIQAKAKTYSKSFKEWFGDSKLVDENGEPLIDDITPKVITSIPTQEYPSSKEFLSNSTNPYAELLSTTMNKAGISDVQIQYTDVPLNSLLKSDKLSPFTPAAYDSSSNIIYVYKDGDFGSYGSVDDVITHELVHAITVDAIRKNPGALSKEFEAYKATYSDYAATNVFEFAAELFSNPEVLHNARDIEYGDMSLLQKILNYIKGLFGVQTDITDRIADLVVAHNFNALLDSRYKEHNPIPDVLPAASKREQMARDKARDTFSSLARTVEQQLYALKYNKIEPKFDRKFQSWTDRLTFSYSTIKSSITNEALDDIEQYTKGMFEYTDAVLDTIQDAYDTFDILQEKVLNAQANNNVDALNGLDQVLDDFNKDYLTPHLKALTAIYHTLTTEFNSTVYSSVIGVEDYQQLLKIIDGLKRELSSTPNIEKDNIGYRFRNLVVNRVGRFLKQQIGEANDPRMEKILQNWLEFDSDINFWTRWLGVLSSAKNFVLPLVRNVLNKADKQVNREYRSKLSEIVQKASNVSRKDIQKLFERTGKDKTGFLVRERNYGLYHNRKLEFRKKFMKDNSILSLDELKVNPSLYLKYKAEYEKFKTANVERKYTPEFYAAYAKLSLETTEALSDITADIETLLQPFLDEKGKPRFENMTVEEYDRYEILLEQKRNLANPYDYETGEIKSGVAAKIAEELTDLNETLRSGLKSKVNMEAFMDEMDKMSKMEGYSPNGSTLYQAWLDRNTQWVYTEEFEKKVKERAKKDYGETYAKMQEMRQTLLNLYKDTAGNIDDTKMPDIVKEKLRLLDQTMYKVTANAKGSKKKTQLFKAEFSKNVLERGGKTALTSEDYFVDDNGRKRVYSYLLKITPADNKNLRRMPNRNWYETSEESAFYNEKFDRTNTETEQPKLSIPEYDNRKAFQEVKNNPKLYDFYNYAVELMRSANENLTYSKYNNPYKLPQISGNIWDYMGNRGVITGFREFMADCFQWRPEDLEYNQRSELRPDGNEIRLIPTQYTSMLSDPATGTNDLIGALAKYYRMSTNFKYKKELSPQLSRIQNLIDTEGKIRVKGERSGQFEEGAFKPAVNSKLSDRLQDLLDMNLYGRETKKWMAKIGQYEISVDKFLKFFARMGRDQGLGWNTSAAISGAVSATLFYTTDAINKQLYNNSDWRFGIAQVLKDTLTFKQLKQLGKPVSDCKTFALLEMNGLTFGENDITDINLPRITRAIRNIVSPYAAFTLASALPNSAFTAAVYRNHRLITFPDGNKQFISYNNLMRGFPDLSNVTKQAMYYSSKETLWDAYEIKNKTLQIVPKYSAYVDDSLLNSVATSLSFLSSHAEGMAESVDRSGLFRHPALSSILMFRGFIPKNIENTVPTMYWNYETRELAMGTLTSLYYTMMTTVGNKMYKNIKKLANPKVDPQSYLDTLKEEWPGVDVEAAIGKYRKRLGLQIMFWIFFAFIMQSVLSFVGNAGDDDNYLIDDLKLNMLKIGTETGSRYNPMDVFSIVNSITPLIKYVEDWNRIINPVAYVNSRKYKKIKRGAYKGYYGWQKDILRVIPITNAYFRFKNPKERFNNMQNILNKY